MKINYEKIKRLCVISSIVFVFSACNMNKARSWTWYEISHNSVYFNYEDKYGEKDRVEIPGVDVRSFVIVSGIYAKDKKVVYFKDKILEKADPLTFKIISDEYAKDQKAVYRSGEQIDGADPDSFQVLQHIFLGYAKDKNSGYFNGKRIENADPASFQYLSEWWAKDKNNVYNSGQLVEGSDPNSFEVLNTFYGKDQKAVYAFFNGRKIELPYLEPVSFEVLNSYYVKDKDHVYFGIVSALSSGEKLVLVDADSSTFEVCCYEGRSFEYIQYGKDKNNVYYKGKKVEGALLKNASVGTGKENQIIDDFCGLMDKVGLEKITGMNVERSTFYRDRAWNRCVVVLDIGSITLAQDFREYPFVERIAGQYEFLSGKKLSMEYDLGIGDMSSLRFLAGIPSELYFSKNGKTFQVFGSRHEGFLKKDELIQVAKMIVEKL